VEVGRSKENESPKKSGEKKASRPAGREKYQHSPGFVLGELARWADLMMGGNCRLEKVPIVQKNHYHRKVSGEGAQGLVRRRGTADAGPTANERLRLRMGGGTDEGNGRTDRKSQLEAHGKKREEGETPRYGQVSVKKTKRKTKKSAGGETLRSSRPFQIYCQTVGRQPGRRPKMVEQRLRGRKKRGRAPRAGKEKVAAGIGFRTSSRPLTKPEEEIRARKE